MGQRVPKTTISTLPYRLETNKLQKPTKIQQRLLPEGLYKEVDTLLSVETKAFKKFVQAKILARQQEILHEQFLLSLEQWHTDDEMADEDDEISNADSTELEDITDDSTSDEENME